MFLHAQKSTNHVSSSHRSANTHLFRRAAERSFFQPAYRVGPDIIMKQTPPAGAGAGHRSPEDEVRYMNNLPGWLIPGASGDQMGLQEIWANLDNRNHAERSWFHSWIFILWYTEGWAGVQRLAPLEFRAAVQQLLAHNTRRGITDTSLLERAAAIAIGRSETGGLVQTPGPGGSGVGTGARPAVTPGSSQLRNPAEIRGGWVPPAGSAQPTQGGGVRTGPPQRTTPVRQSPPAAPRAQPPTASQYEALNQGGMGDQLAAGQRLMANPATVYHHHVRSNLRDIVTTQEMIAGSGTDAFGGGHAVRAYIGPARGYSSGQGAVEFTTTAQGSPRPYQGPVGAQWLQSSITIRITRILLPHGEIAVPNANGTFTVTNPNGTQRIIQASELPN